MKLRLLSTLSAVTLSAVCACSSSPTTTNVDPTNPAGSAPGDDAGRDGALGSEDPAKQPPHSLGVITLGEAHGSGAASRSTPVVSAVFLPDALLGRACTKKLEDGCELQEVAKCRKVSTTSGCNSNEACVLDLATCKGVCRAPVACAKPCDEDEVCKAPAAGSTDAAGTCVKAETFDAGPLAFSGTTTPITLFPPYKFESIGQGAPFLGGSELRVQASGATDAGFEKFDEKFTATTFLQTKPALAKIPKGKVFGGGPLPIAWVPANDTIVVTVTGAGGSATCKAKDSLGTFDVPRSVVEAAQGDGPASSAISVTVARQRKDVKKDKTAKGTMSLAEVKTAGWLELVTVSVESAYFQGCTGSGSQDLCGDKCTDVSYDVSNCGTCGNECGATQTCSSGKCSGGTPPPPPPPPPSSTCTSCRVNATAPIVGGCSAAFTTCDASTECRALYQCTTSCTTSSCLATCESQYPTGKAKFAPLKTCLSNACMSSCGF